MGVWSLRAFPPTPSQVYITRDANCDLCTDKKRDLRGSSEALNVYF